jgi:glucose-6-phosphate isomerase/transaldolase/glucose-6-phosphate isomerase
VAGEPVGGPEVYGDDRVFVHLRGDKPKLDDKMQGLAHAGQAVITIPTHGAKDLGRLFFFAEFATAVSGWVLQINPFDQPNVQEAKDNTKRVLDEGAPEIPTGSIDDISAAPPQYVAILAYVPPSDATDERAAEVRRKIRDDTKATTTFGYGPRYLHSTGQYHKGGPPNGVFVQVFKPTDDSEFGRLVTAQAAGDYLTLQSHGLAVVRVEEL